tara:strand:- start:16124 stop:16456 length:333 start_codon:yes stop_codon:yes gene_type:complete
MAMTNTNETQHRGRSGRSGLVALNLALLAILGLVTLSPQVGAQMEGNDMRVRGVYTVIGSDTLGETASTIHVLDSANREIVSLRWNESTKALEGLGFRDLVRDVNSDPER